jgi:uncharacterized protein (TIGR03118 family)
MAAPALLGVMTTIVSLLSASPAAAQGYLKLNLVSKTPGQAIRTDPNLGETWGIVASAGSPWWVSNAATGTSTLYDGFGNIRPLVVTVPPKAGSTAKGTPTGIVFNSTADFMVSRARLSAAALFIFATLDGTISGWNPLVSPTSAVIGFSNPLPGASYTGLAIGTEGVENYLFAANYGTGFVDVINSTFGLDSVFTDPFLVRAGFAPFGIQNINIGGFQRLYVTFAPKVASAPGTGFVDVFDTTGHLMKRLVANGPLNQPWGLTLSPRDYGVFSNALLVGNLADGHINAFNPTTGAFLGWLADPAGKPISIPALWGIGFGNDHSSGKANALYYASGTGIFGVIYARGVPLR